MTLVIWIFGKNASTDKQSFLSILQQPVPWLHNLNVVRFLNLNIHVSLECTTANLATEGLGPCKRASQASHGSIDIKLPVINQAAVIALTANSPVNTRVRLICTDIVSAGVFSVGHYILWLGKCFELIDDLITHSLANWQNCNSCGYT